MVYILAISFIPVVLKEIDTSQTTLINFDVATELFDPFEHEFSFAFGFPNPIDERVGTLSLTYETKKWVENEGNHEEVKTSTPIPLHSCKESAVYPMSKKRTPISLMCFNELPSESRSLTGDYFSDVFTYF